MRITKLCLLFCKQCLESITARARIIIMKVRKFKSIFCHVPQSSIVFADCLYQRITIAGPISHASGPSHMPRHPPLRWSIPRKHVRLELYIPFGCNVFLPSTKHNNHQLHHQTNSIYTSLIGVQLKLR